MGFYPRGWKKLSFEPPLAGLDLFSVMMAVTAVADLIVVSMPPLLEEYRSVPRTIYSLLVLMLLSQAE
jgi:hypothetical protein